MDAAQAISTTPSVTPAASEAATASAVSSDFETFLKMLTVQMQNQDPLNPIESSDYAVQLATFSGVEQQVRTNTLLESLASQFGAMGMSQLAGWVGMEARAAGPANFEGSPITVMPQIAAGADGAIMNVRDGNGAIVQSFDIGASEDSLEWAGVDSSGTPYSNGTYRFEIESYSGEELIGTQTGEVYSRIVEARESGARTLLILESGAEVTADDISALRDI